MSERLQNWARSFEYGAAELHVPGSVEEIQEIVSRSDRVKALGTKHSFSEIADTEGDLVSTERLNRVLNFDAGQGTVTVEAGIRYGELARHLDAQGFALHNLASLPHLSVGGACATATHGSGVGNGNLSTAVCGLKFVAADGSIVSMVRDRDPGFFGVVVGLGAFGVITELTLDIEPTFEMTQHVYDNLAFEQLETHFDEIMSCAYSVSLFTYWTGPVIDQVWVKRRATGESLDASSPTLFGATPAKFKRSPLPDGDVDNCTDQIGIPGPWFDRLPHFRMGFTPSSGEELQTEYFIPKKHAWEALRAIDGIRDQVAPLLHTTEIRTIAADSFWMSPCFHTASVAIHFTWKKNWVKVSALLPIIEELLAPFHALPHWGKLFTLPPDILQTRYPKLPDFRSLVAAHDPSGKFRNAFTDRLQLHGFRAMP